MIKDIVEAKSFQNFITGLIILNGITLGMGTSKDLIASYGNILALIDGIVIGIFTIEILMRISVYKKDFFKDPWSLFDFAVVVIALVPASGPFAILRVLRVLRLFRLLTIIPQMRTIVGALIGVIPGIGAVSMVLLLFFYVFAIMATTMYGEAFPQWFGTLGETMYTLFQIMTLESWSMGIARPVIEVFPYAWIFFVIYILLVTFVMVNLFIGLIVDAIFTIKHEDEEEQRSKELEEISALRSEIQELKELIKAKG
ncbi:MAG: ion transporter [Campylobacterales bacterium]|nr:ion transporter [Campylobacterales bacterium]